MRVFKRKVGVTHVSVGAKECGQLCVKMFTKLLLGDPNSTDFLLGPKAPSQEMQSVCFLFVFFGGSTFSDWLVVITCGQR